nr:hypothetical protein [Saprospiraceae bacterium]
MIRTLSFILCLLFLSSTFSEAHQQKSEERNTPDSLAYSSMVPNAWIQQFALIERWVAGMRPTVTSRALAYISIGAYEVALPSMKGYRSNQELIPGLKIPALPL